MSKQYMAYVMSYEEFKEVVGENPSFSEDGFLSNTTDWWGDLEKYLDVPVVSVRPSGRTCWNEVIILTAAGKVGKKNAINGDLAICKDIMIDIFREADNDQYEVFDQYKFPDLKKEDRKKLRNWVHKTY